MTWQKLKEKIEDHIVTVVLALVGSLCVIIWQAVPSETWARIGEAIPKRVLGALIGLLLIALSASIARIFSLRRIRSKEQAEISGLKTQIPKLQLRAGELSSQVGTIEYENRLLKRKVEQLSYQFEFDDEVVGILSFLAEQNAYPNTIANSMGLKPSRVEYYLVELEQQGYVKSHFSMTAPQLYSLSQLGREFLLKKGLI